jgi:hypothetical protein
MSVPVVKPFLSWMFFWAIIKFKSNLKTNTKQRSFVCGVHSPIVRCLLALRTLEPLSSGPCLFRFMDLKHKFEAYLDDLASRSCKRKDHPTHLRLIFDHCRYFMIRLNPNKCIFCVVSGRLLGFIISTTGIMVDPLKVEAIIQLPPPHTILQLQSLQGNANLLRCFIANYAEITKGYMRLLKKDVPFFWDEAAQCSIDALKHALTTAPLLWPPNYNKDFLLYLDVAESTIGMVLVQGDDSFFEYVIYYLSRGLVGLELNYTHLKKIALAAVHAVQ